MTNRIVRTGKWLYDGSVSKTVYIIEAKYSFFDNVDEDEIGDLGPGKQPELHGDGLCYYVYFRKPTPELAVPADSPGFSTIQEASEHAESRAPTPIEWVDTRAA